MDHRELAALRKLRAELDAKIKRLRPHVESPDLDVDVRRKAGEALKALEAAHAKVNGNICALEDASDATATANRVLTRKQRHARVNENVTDSHKRALSVAAGGADDFVKAFHKAGFPSLRDLAEALGVDVSFLSRVHSGDKPMPRKRAQEIEKLTGYPASRWTKR